MSLDKTPQTGGVFVTTREENHEKENNKSHNLQRADRFASSDLQKAGQHLDISRHVVLYSIT